MKSNLKIMLMLLSLISGSGYAYEMEDSVPVEQLNELLVTGNSARSRLNNVRLGAENLEISQLMTLPKFGGEADIIKSISLLPGVRSEGDGGGGFEVRGGNASQNLVLLDGITLYNPSHVMGIFSTFNDDAIGGATLYKGTLPTMYGNASSSVLSTTLENGKMSSFHGSATIGILAAKVKISGPILKDKLSFAITARRSYVDAFLKMVPKYRSTEMNFYDVTAKVRYRPSQSQIIDGAFFLSHDNMAISDLMGMFWGNIGGAINWNVHANDRLNLNTSLSMTHFNPKMEMDIMDNNQVMWTYIHTYSITERINHYLSENHSLEYGLRSELLQVKSAEWMLNSTKEREIRSLWENSVWAEYTGSFGGLLDLTAGTRINTSSAISAPGFHSFKSAGVSDNQFKGKTYLNIEPRLNLKFNLSQFQNIKVSFGTSSQNLHALRSSTTSFPFDRYALTSAHVKPEISLQYGVGYAGMTNDGEYDWSAEGYYRSIDNVYDFKDGKSTFSDIVLESIILGGRGRSYGAEFMVRKNKGKLTGWIAYTISRTETKISGINGGKWYNASNDRRNDLSIAAIYRFSDKWSISGSWIFMSGQPLTAPDVKYVISGETCYYYSKRNSYKTPPVHRLDLSAQYIHKGNKITYEWAFGIYNAYCRYNPYVVYFQDDPSKPSGTRAVIRAMYGLIPSLSYTLRF